MTVVNISSVNDVGIPRRRQHLERLRIVSFLSSSIQSFRWYNQGYLRMGCSMNFLKYPFDVQECLFRLTSADMTVDHIQIRMNFSYSQENQRPTPYKVIFKTK